MAEVEDRRGRAVVRRQGAVQFPEEDAELMGSTGDGTGDQAIAEGACRRS